MRIFTAALALALTTGAAHAQDMYLGVAFDYGKPHAGDDQTAASLMAGVAFDAGTIGYGAEIEYGASSTFGGDYDIARIRAVGSYDLGSMSALASVGATQYDTGVAKFSGYNFGLGVQVPVNDALDVRAELIRDMMDDFGNNVTTTRLAAVYAF